MLKLNDFNKDDILAALGLETRRGPGSYLVPSLAMFGAGLLVGAGIALLLAPKSGDELRRDLAEEGRRALETARAQVSTTGSDHGTTATRSGTSGYSGTIGTSGTSKV